jgi:hypothetical protein
MMHKYDTSALVPVSWAGPVRGRFSLCDSVPEHKPHKLAKN